MPKEITEKTIKKKKKKAPVWGNLISYGDEDILSIGLLCSGGMHVPALYHATQAVEKYFKALILSILDPGGITLNPKKKKWIYIHDLEELASYCSGRYPYYNKKTVIDSLKLFSEYDQATRYPWVNRKFGNGFSGSDFKVFEEILLRLRNDIPIYRDDYKLGIAIRGHHHHTPSHEVKGIFSALEKIAVEHLRKIFPKINGFVRWSKKKDSHVEN